MRLRGLFTCAVLAGASLVLSGCAGYHLGPVKPAALAHVRSVAVPSFKNYTLEPRLEVLLANALIKQIQQDGSYRVTSEKDADAIIEGSVTRIERTPLRGSRSDSSPGVTADFYQTTEFGLELSVSIKVVEKSTGASLASRSTTGTASFFVSGANPRTAHVNRDELQAIPQAAEVAAIHLTSFLSEGW